MTNLLERIEFTDEMIDEIAHRLVEIFGSPEAAIDAMYDCSGNCTKSLTASSG
jgi:hypothetical protein